MTFLDIPNNATIRREVTGNTQYLKAYFKSEGRLLTRYIGKDPSLLTRIFKINQISKKTKRNLGEIINNMNLQLRNKNLNPENDDVFDNWLDAEFLRVFGISSEKIK